MKDIQGEMPFRQGNTWYRVVGDTHTGTPLVLLHGGPGYPSYYLENLTKLASADRAVIVYDQMSCGRSSGDTDPASWTMDTFVDQLTALHDYLRLESVDVLGHSWGGFLALEVALRHSIPLRRLVLASTSPSSRMFVDAATSRMQTLAPEHVAAIEAGEASGDYQDPAYQRANNAFLAEFCDRIDPLPEGLQRSDDEHNTALYQHMWGPTEFRCNGTLANWDVSARLGEVDLPVLITSGEYDEAGPDIQQFMLSQLPNARWQKFPNSAHQSHVTDEESYLTTVSAFVSE